MPETESDWFKAPPAAVAADEVMYVDVAGYEGPLDLLLDLARRQQVDLARISVLALAEQYLKFIEQVRAKRLEIAADYLVMAAWLAYLKSRLMVPQLPSDEEPSGEMMAALLQFRLKRLEAMRDVGRQLLARSCLGISIHARGVSEPLTVNRRKLWDASLYDLLKAYAAQRERAIVNDYVPSQRTVWSLQAARDILQRLVGQSVDWVPLDTYLSHYLSAPESRTTVRASSFASSLELVRQGELELRQAEAFGPLLVRRRPAR